MSDHINVAIRLRPLINSEINENQKIKWIVDDETISLLDVNNKKSQERYTFDHVFDTNSETEDIYKTVVHPVIISAINGMNATIFAYGQTASGKTHTMSGTGEKLGIIPLTINNLMKIIKGNTERKYLIRVAYIEIYNEKINDLLNLENKNIKIHEDLSGNITVSSKEIVVTDCSEVLSLLRKGNKNRQSGVTNMNKRSSRSHTIFKIIIESTEEFDSTRSAFQISHINLVDLAGSERTNLTKATGTRLKEGGHINKSLSTLTLVIKQVSENQSFVNFRDSKLTRILQQCLGGNSKATLIAAITPTDIETTQSTLAFAQRAKTIKNKPVVNCNENDALIKCYVDEIADLKLELSKAHNRNINLTRSKDELNKRIKLLENDFITSDYVRRHTIGFSKELPRIHRAELNYVTPKSNCVKRVLDVVKEVDESNISPLEVVEQNDETPNSTLRLRLKIIENDYHELQEYTKLEMMYNKEETISDLRDQIRKLTHENLRLQEEIKEVKATQRFSQATNCQNVFKNYVSGVFYKINYTKEVNREAFLELFVEDSKKILKQLRKLNYCNLKHELGVIIKAMNNYGVRNKENIIPNFNANQITKLITQNAFLSKELVSQNEMIKALNAACKNLKVKLEDTEDKYLITAEALDQAENDFEAARIKIENLTGKLQGVERGLKNRVVQKTIRFEHSHKTIYIVLVQLKNLQVPTAALKYGFALNLTILKCVKEGFYENLEAKYFVFTKEDVLNFLHFIFNSRKQLLPNQQFSTEVGVTKQKKIEQLLIINSNLRRHIKRLKSRAENEQSAFCKQLKLRNLMYNKLRLKLKQRNNLYKSLLNINENLRNNLSNTQILLDTQNFESTKLVQEKEILLNSRCASLQKTINELSQEVVEAKLHSSVEINKLKQSLEVTNKQLSETEEFCRALRIELLTETTKNSSKFQIIAQNKIEIASLLSKLKENETITTAVKQKCEIETTKLRNEIALLKKHESTTIQINAMHEKVLQLKTFKSAIYTTLNNHEAAIKKLIQQYDQIAKPQTNPICCETCKELRNNVQFLEKRYVTLQKLNKKLQSDHHLPLAKPKLPCRNCYKLSGCKKLLETTLEFRNNKILDLKNQMRSMRRQNAQIETFYRIKIEIYENRVKELNQRKCVKCDERKYEDKEVQANETQVFQMISLCEEITINKSQYLKQKHNYETIKSIARSRKKLIISLQEELQKSGYQN